MHALGEMGEMDIKSHIFWNLACVVMCIQQLDPEIGDKTL